MKTNLSVTDTAPVYPQRYKARPYLPSHETRVARGYEAALVIDAVEIEKGEFRALSHDKPLKNPSRAQAGRGVFIDVWA